MLTPHPVRRRDGAVGRDEVGGVTRRCGTMSSVTPSPDLVVLHDVRGRTLAFGPGHAPQSAALGTAGLAWYATRAIRRALSVRRAPP